MYTPCGILLDGLSGKELFAGRGNLEEELASDLVDLNPIHEEELAGKCFAVDGPGEQGHVEQGRVACKVLGQEESLCLEGAPHEKLKKAHSFRHRGMPKSNVGKVIQAL